jgi:ADP-heptose:LPS heptosyltransferase
VGKPILVLQMQRMGDLILSFPLFLWLTRLHPGTPIWVVGNAAFYRELLPLSPEGVSYLPWEESGPLTGKRFSRIINLSHLAQAAELAGSVRAEEKIGPVRTKGTTYVRGSWQLYRTSLTGNNRHNRYHWAELNGLDAVPARVVGSTGWPHPRTLSASNRNVGLFLGASEPEKRPDSAFWAGLVRGLLDRGMLPILLGGAAEQGLGTEVASLSGRNPLNLCGKMDLAGLARIGQSLQLLITPDTGPMHLASWTGVKVLDLSMGPVNPWETGPYHPGQFVLAPATSCMGCWTCSRGGHPCSALFLPARVASLAGAIVRGHRLEHGPLRLHGLVLYRTTKDALGFHGLKRVDSEHPTAREQVGRFWQAHWAAELGLLLDEGRRAAVWAVLRDEHPRLAERFPLELARLGLVLSRHRFRSLASPSETLWRERPPFLRPLAGFLEHYLQNNDHSEQSFRNALSMIERLLSVTG